MSGGRLDGSPRGQCQIGSRMTTESALDPRGYRDAIGRFATGVTVITWDDGEVTRGMTANAIASISLDPMLLMICIDKKVSAHPQLMGARAFAVNILAHDQFELSKTFASHGVEGMAGGNPVITALIQLNGHDRFDVREGAYFNVVQPYQHHTNCPAVGINVYSFALQPEQHQPSGTCNLSRIDNTTLLLTVSNNAVGLNLSSTVRVYATNYNVLRIMSGMGGLAYSN